MDLDSRNATYRRMSAEDEEMYMRLPVPPVSLQRVMTMKFCISAEQKIHSQYTKGAHDIALG